MHTDRIARLPVDALRPDLPLPLPPASRSRAVLRSMVTGLREPRFADAHRALQWGVLAVALLVVVGWLRSWVGVLAIVLTAALLVRVIALSMLQRRQHVFERQWLDVQSDVLRTASFEIVRFGVRANHDFDLTRPADVQELLAWQAEQRPVPVRIDFAYAPTAIETVHLDLRDITFVPSDGVRRSRVRFPDARYHGQPAMNRAGWRRPSRTAFWVLGRALASANTGGDVASATRGGSVPAVP